VRIAKKGTYTVKGTAQADIEGATLKAEGKFRIR
jgi:hypothetical protein